jgi:hypothetical protein
MVERTHVCRITLAVFVGVWFAGREALAGNEANFVLYDHHTDARGTTEINVGDARMLLRRRPVPRSKAD